MMACFELVAGVDEANKLNRSGQGQGHPELNKSDATLFFFDASLDVCNPDQSQIEHKLQCWLKE